jgi:hypothetical protein
MNNRKSLFDNTRISKPVDISCTDSRQLISTRYNNQITWDKRKPGTVFSLERPSFKSNISSFEQSRTPSTNSIMNKRVGVGNRTLKRQNFLAPDIMPRMAGEFDKIKAHSIAQFGTKVSLSDETIDKLIRFQSPDPRDFEWLREKARLIAAGNLNALPLGRTQREISKTVNFGKANLNLEDRLSAISSAVEQGISETLQNRVLLGAEIARVLENVDATSEDLNRLRIAVGTLKISKDWKKAGFAHQLWSVRQLIESNNLSGILLYTLSNIPPGKSAENIVKDRRGKVNAQMSLSTFIKIIKKSKKSGKVVFNVEDRSISTPQQIMESVLGGTDGGFLDDIFYVGNERLSRLIISGEEDLVGIRQILQKEGKLPIDDGGPPPAFGAPDVGGPADPPPPFDDGAEEKKFE